MQSTTEPQQGQLDLSQSVATQNSPIAYGMGSFGMESLYIVFAGFYMFYYIDELGLTVAMAAIINVIYGIYSGEVLLKHEFWMYPCNQHIFVMGTIMDRYFAPAR